VSSSNAPVRGAPRAAFYCMSSDVYFLGAVGMINSLRLLGHREPIYLLDLGLTEEQRELLGPEVTIVEPGRDSPPWLLKTAAPLAHPAEVMVQIDADMVATRSLSPLIDRAEEGEVVAFENNMDRFVPEWAEVLDLADLRRQRYVCSGLVAMGGEPGREVIRLLDDKLQRVEFERTYLAEDADDYPLRFLDQDVLNAILASRIPSEQVAPLDYRLAPMPPFTGLGVVDEVTLRCAYEDGVEPYVVHHYLAKPWLEPTLEGVYSKLLRRLLIGPDISIRVPLRELPLRLRGGPLAYAERKRVNLATRLRWHVGEPLSARIHAHRSSRSATTDGRPQASPRGSDAATDSPVGGAAFYCVCDARYFLGAAAMVNSLRLLGHREPIYLLDCGLEDWQRQAAAPEVRIQPMARSHAPHLEKAIAALRHPAEVFVLIDADMIATRSLSPLIEQAREGNVVAFRNNVDRFVPEWGELLELGDVRREPYLCSALVAMGAEPGEEILRLMEDRRSRVEFERSFWEGNDADYPFLYADQDLLNAILASRVEPERVVRLDHRLAPAPPFSGLGVVDEANLRCAYEDGTEPYVLHHILPAKPWLEPTHHGIYSRLLRRLLIAGDGPIQVPREKVPLRLRGGPLAYAERKRVNLGQRLRWHVGEPLSARLRERAGRRRAK
jgi:lipopolysaccharide biosynthesis glycosyltransferase